MDKDPSQAAPGAELPEECEASRRSIAEYVGRGEKREGFGDFRKHLTECCDCMQVYRETMSAAARMGRSLRDERVDTQRVLRHRGMQQRAKKATGEPGRRNRYALRLVLLPAAMALLFFLQQALKPDEGLVLHWTGGEVHLGDFRLNADFPKQALREEGVYCYTRGNASAELYAVSDPEQPVFKLGVRSALLVTHPKQREVRLESGELTILGASTILSQYGAARLDEGEAVMTIRDLKFELKCNKGSVVFLTPAGEQVLGAGENLRLGKW